VLHAVDTSNIGNSPRPSIKTTRPAGPPFVAGFTFAIVASPALIPFVQPSETPNFEDPFRTTAQKTEKKQFLAGARTFLSAASWATTIVHRNSQARALEEVAAPGMSALHSVADLPHSALCFLSRLKLLTFRFQIRCSHVNVANVYGKTTPLQILLRPMEHQ
jgi:hypothetical protein